MPHHIYAGVVASITDLKKNPMGTVEAGDGEVVAILNRNEPAFYCVPADRYEELMEYIDDLELAREAEARIDERENWEDSMGESYCYDAAIIDGEVVFDEPMQKDDEG